VLRQSFREERMIEVVLVHRRGMPKRTADGERVIREGALTLLPNKDVRFTIRCSEITVMALSVPGST